MKRYARKLGILGGMGPEATASLYLNIIARCQRELGAKYNSDFPPIIINSCPVPDGRMWKGFDKAEVEDFLRVNIKTLERTGVDFIVIPCNSVHYFLPVMRKAVNIPVLSIVEETAKEIKKTGLSKVLLLATEFTIYQGIYEQPLAEREITLIKPSRTQQRLLEKIIIRTESGQRSNSDRGTVVDIINDLRKTAGIQGVVAGCTEIPLLIQQIDIPVQLFDTIDVLAASSYALIRGKQTFDPYR
jgi:aspartate racemase